MGPTIGRFRKETQLRHEINVTPFVDVMLVLLVIFMVSAPLMTSGISVDLPEGKAPVLSNSHPLTLTLDQNGKLFLKEKTITKEELLTLLASIPEAREERIFLRAHRSLPYEEVMAIMSIMANAGYTKVALVMEGK